MSRTKMPRPLAITVWILRTVLLAIILIVPTILFWRMCTSGNPKAVKYLSPNQNLRDAYATHGDNLILQYQKQASITRAESNAGYFSVTQCVFIPEANQVQIVFRYNNSTLRHLAEDYKLDSVPAKSGTWFDVTLVKTTDLTPESKDDNLDPATLSTERFFPSGEPIRDETGLYTFFRYTFDNITIDDLTDGIYVDVYYNGALDYSEKPYGTLCIYAYDSEWIPYRMTASEKKSLQK